MPKQTIHLFMWGYQRHFRIGLHLRAREVLSQIGLDIDPTVLLVGVRRDGVTDRHPLCIEPEEGRWSPAMFPDIHARIAQATAAHPDQRIIYSNDDEGMREKPERIHRYCIGDEIRQALDIADAELGVRTFCSSAHPVEGHYVACALQLPRDLFEQFPPIPYVWMGEQHETSFLTRCIDAILDDAKRVLIGPDPGRSASGLDLRPADELVREAAASLLRVPVIEGSFAYSDMFRELNQLSQLMYEGRKGLGRMVLANADDPNINYLLRLKKPVPFTQTRWVRKLLQMATSDTVLVADYRSISGLGIVRDEAARPYGIDFLDQHEWDFRRGDQVLLRTRFGDARLPQEPISADRFADNLRRHFAGISDGAAERHWAALNQMADQAHGSMIVIAADAESEAKRLELQGTAIEPTLLTPALVERASKIDGTILVDPDGLCHAVGVILDGQANEECTPARGARYNSGIRYVGDGRVPRMALVVSEDRTLDIVPLLQRRVARKPIADAVEALSVATVENFHAPRNILDRYRFYLSPEQCDIANAALDRIDAVPLELYEIRWTGPRFEPDPRMDQNYLID